MGHLKFCLEYAVKSQEVLGGVFSAIKLQFRSEHDKQLLEVLGSVPIQEQVHCSPRARDSVEGPCP